MKNIKISKRAKLTSLVALVLAVLLCLSSCGGTKASSTPKSSDANGTIANTAIDWKFTSSDNTLVISGIGAIPDFDKQSDRPWNDVARSIEVIKFTGDITAIGKLAFAYCSSLQKIEIPETVTAIGDSAFEGCAKLETVDIGTSLTSLGERAFAFCSSLKVVRLLSAVDIKNETFYNCRALTSLVVDAGISADKVADSAFKNTDFTFGKATPYSSEKVSVTVKYVYEDGSEAHESFVSEGYSVGTPFNVPSPTIEGYEADTLTVSGVAAVGGNTVTVTYKKIVVETEAVSDTDTSPAEADEPNYVFLVITIVVIAGVAVGGYLLMKSNKKNEEKAKNQNKAKNRKQK